MAWKPLDESAPITPKSTILFVSDNQCPTLAQEALRTSRRAQGYVVKSDAASELLPAMKAVMKGRQFISSSLRTLKLIDASGA